MVRDMVRVRVEVGVVECDCIHTRPPAATEAMVKVV